MAMTLAPWADTERMPTLNEESAERLRSLIDQPHAPTFNNRSGHHLNKDDLETLKNYTKREMQKSASPIIDQNDWMTDFIEYCLTKVPFYQDYLKGLNNLADMPTVDRAELSKDITKFIPNDLPIDQLIAYETSGTTGHPLLIPSHPTVAARYSCYHKKALSWNNVNTEEFESDLAIMLAGYQEKCFTYASISPYLNNKGLVKLNFHPNDWLKSSDRQKYIDINKPDLISGDPVSLDALSEIPFQHKPKALLSTSMSLLDGCRNRLKNRFGCPVIDLYSLNEVGPVGCSVPGKQGFKLLQSQLFVEALDEYGTPLPIGQRGEITVTGGFNHCLPLLRYKTGDYGCLEQEGNDWFIRNLEGRPPVQYKTTHNEWINNVDITHLLNKYPLSQFSLHQHSDGSLTLYLLSMSYSDKLKQLIKDKLGFPVTVQPLSKTDLGSKVIQYTSDIFRNPK